MGTLIMVGTFIMGVIVGMFFAKKIEEGINKNINKK